MLGFDGVSCSVCHQIEDRDLGNPVTFTGNYRIDTRRPWTERLIYGPFVIDAGRRRVMESTTEFLPATANHLAKAELCATCHTLYTQLVGSSPSPASSPSRRTVSSGTCSAAPTSS